MKKVHLFRLVVAGAILLAAVMPFATGQNTQTAKPNNECCRAARVSTPTCQNKKTGCKWDGMNCVVAMAGSCNIPDIGQTPLGGNCKAQPTLNCKMQATTNPTLLTWTNGQCACNGSSTDTCFCTWSAVGDPQQANFNDCSKNINMGNPPTIPCPPPPPPGGSS